MICLADRFVQAVGAGHFVILAILDHKYMSIITSRAI